MRAIAVVPNVVGSVVDTHRTAGVTLAVTTADSTHLTVDARSAVNTADHPASARARHFHANRSNEIQITERDREPD
jgi:hypothetical protein